MAMNTLGDYIEHLKVTHAKSTIKTFKSILLQWEKTYNSALTPEKNYDAYLLAKRNTCSSAYTHLCATVIRGYLQYCGVDITNFAVPRNTNPRREPLSPKELSKVLDYTRDSYDYYIISLLVNTGLRVSELCNLKWDDIDFNSKKLTVTNGKGNKKRNVPLNNEAVETLQELSPNFYEYVVTRWDGAKITPRAIQLSFQKISDNTCIKVTPHMLRHTFATRMIQKGLDVTILQKILGHESLNTTQQYIHHDFNTILQKFMQIQ